MYKGQVQRDVPVIMISWESKRLVRVSRQEFTLDYPLANSSYTGNNVYAILRAPKAASTEALGETFSVQQFFWTWM